MKLLKFNQILVTIFKLSGVLPVAISKSRPVEVNRSLIWLLCNVILMIYVVTVAISSLKNKTFNKFTTIELITRVMISLVESSAMLAVLATHSCKNKKFLGILNKILLLNQEVMSASARKSSLRKKVGNAENYFKSLCLAQLVFTVALPTIECVKKGVFTLSTFKHLISVSIISSVMLQMIFVVNYMRLQFAAINNSLESLGGWDFRRVFVVENQARRISTKNEFMYLRKLHRFHCEIVEDVAKFYSWVILLIISNYTLATIYDCYMLTKIIEKLVSLHDIKSAMLDVLWFVTHSFLPVNLILCINGLEGEAKVTSDIVHTFMDSHIGNIEISRQLRLFSKELLHRNLKFSGCGLCILDCSLLSNIASTIITYLIILCQLDKSLD